MSILIVTVICFVFYFLSDSSVKITNYPSSGTEIIAFGDSLVEGVGSTNGGDMFSLLSQKIGVPIRNFGRGGDTTAQALERLPVVLNEVPHPKVAIILLGGNDFLQKKPRSETFGNLSKIIKAFQDQGAVVLLLGVRGGIIKDNFEAEFERLRDTLGTAYVPNVLDGLITKRELMYDSIHPNNKGYVQIADKIFPVLKVLIH